MRRINRRVSALCLSLVVCLSSPLRGQQLRLRAILEKDAYFEAEPVYLVLELTNTGGGTAWVSHFPLVYGNLEVSMVKDGVQAVPATGFIVNQITPPAWRGIAVDPGDHLYEAVVVQVGWGDEPALGSRLFRRHLAPGTYEVHAYFEAHNGLPDAPLRIDAAPASFQVRAASVSENAIVRQVESIRALPWSAALRGQSVTALVDWAENRVAQDPNDPFLAFLLSYGLQTTAAAGVTPDPTTLARLGKLRGTVVRTQAAPSVAVVVEAIAYDTTALAALAPQVASSLGRQVVQYHLSRIKARRKTR